MVIGNQVIEAPCPSVSLHAKANINIQSDVTLKVSSGVQCDKMHRCDRCLLYGIFYNLIFYCLHAFKWIKIIRSPDKHCRQMMVDESQRDDV